MSDKTAFSVREKALGSKAWVAYLVLSLTREMRMASRPTPGWVRGFIVVLAVIAAVVVLLHAFGLAPHMHHMMH